ncbi:MAG: long-chain fatty acid--CoA ligase [Bacteroidales bacterium]|nr:long-chain fatty acid--CoA ligase [Candidatus Colimorpha pelethequi]
MELKRLFDLLDYRKETQPDRAVFVAKQNGEWHKVFIDEYIDKVNKISYALLHRGLQKGDKVALISADRPEWNFVDMAVQQIGCVLVPIYPTISLEDYHFILTNSEVKCIFLDTESLLKKLKGVLSGLENLKDIVMFSELKTPEEYADIAAVRPIVSFAEMLQLGEAYANPEKVQELKDSIQTRDVATMIYTSGTTGFPKGVMLCHENILVNIHGVEHTPKPYFTRAMSFLPLCHIYERMMNYFYQYMGYETYYAENVGKVVENMKYARPYMMTAVPRFIEKMYDGIYRKGEKMKGLKKKIFYWSLSLATKYDLDGTSWWYKIRRQWADVLVYHQIRESFGGCLEMFVSGGSAIQPRLARFFSCVGMNIYEGYGLTETAPVIAVSSAAPHGRKLGTAGLPLPGIEVKILEDSNEIVCRGKNVMLGYYKNPEQTALAIDSEGWFHTGDTGAFEPEGQLRITGRTKTMFKTSMGKFVNPEVLEEKFKESPFILDMMVVGENQKFAAAIIVPDFNFLKDWQKRHGISCATQDEMVHDKKTLARFRKVVDKYNKQFGATEQIKKYVVINDVWDVQNGCLTPTLKIKRAVISERCKKEIEGLFA